MIRYIRGTLRDYEPGVVVLETNGLGYKIATPRLDTSITIGTTLELHTYLAVRENALDLYGFTTRDELEIFELLLTLPKIGPKSALQILSQADVETLKKAVLSSDASYLSKLSGIGKKTAEKIVAELGEKFADRYTTATPGTPSEVSHTNDVIDALVALGYPLPDARTVAKELSPDLSANEAIKEALQILGKT